MARDHRLWGAERIRGELLKVGMRVSKRTIQQYLRKPRARPSSRDPGILSCATTHLRVSACDCLPVTDLFFRSLFAFFIIELHSRTGIPGGVTRHPCDA
jgi:hypothetical protein